MFGLMQFHSCHKSDEERAQQRLLYCGTCKSIGAMYGQSARFFLNNDVVFLAQLLEAIASPERKMHIPEQSALKDFNCLTLPHESEIADSLRVASTVCVALARLKVEDHRQDSKSGAWNLATNVFSKQFQSCFDQLSALGFPTQELQSLTARQAWVENSPMGDGTAPERLHHLANETALITAMVFKHAALAVKSCDKSAQSMYAIGQGFGKLIYLLDALEDFERDGKRKQFNAVAAAFELQSSLRKITHLPEYVIDATTSLLAQEAASVVMALRSLTLDSEEFRSHKTTLMRNLLRRVNMVYEAWGYQPRHHLGSTRNGFQSRHHQSTCIGSHAGAHTNANKLENACTNMAETLDFKYALSRAKELSFTSDCALWIRASSPFVFLWVFFVALLAPTHSRLAPSYQQHLQLSLNLIFWGAVFASFIRVMQIGNQKLQYAFAMVGDKGDGNTKDEQPRRESEPARPFKERDDEEQINLVQSENLEPAQGDEQVPSQNQPPPQSQPGQDLFRQAHQQLFMQAQQELLQQAQTEHLAKQQQQQQQQQQYQQQQYQQQQRQASSSPNDDDDALDQHHRHGQPRRGKFHRSRGYQSPYYGAGACLCCDGCGTCGEDVCFTTTPRRSRWECCCLDCDDCFACGCEGGCDICSSTGGECCTGCECCSGGSCCAAEHCCAGADCCNCCAGADCASGLDCCTAIDCGAASC